jgi:hypothetical protein
MKRLVFVIVCSMLTGCAGQTPLQQLSDVIGQIPDNAVMAMLEKDCKAALADVDSWKGKISASEELAARSCSTFILAAEVEHRQDIAEMQSIVLSVDSALTGIADGTPMGIVQALVRSKFAPQGAEGADLKPRIDALIARKIKRASGIRNACANLIDDQKLMDLARKVFGGM